MGHPLSLGVGGLSDALAGCLTSDSGTTAGGIDPPGTHLMTPAEEAATPQQEPVVDTAPADAAVDNFTRALRTELARRGRS